MKIHTKLKKSLECLQWLIDSSSSITGSHLSIISNPEWAREMALKE
jgi:hypothetical protein